VIYWTVTIKLFIMKKITLIFFLLTISLGYSQVVLEDFSSGITASNWKGDAGLGSATTETLSPNGLVGKIITSSAAGAEVYQNAQLYLQKNSIDLSTTNKVVTVAVYSTVPFDMLAKVVDGGSAAESAAEASHNGSGWQTLSFDFSAPKDGTPVANGQYARILFFPLWKLGGGFKAAAVTTTYVDNISGKAGAVIAAELPAGPAAPPARTTSDYVSFYNGIASPVTPQYSNLANVAFDSFGGSTIVGDVTLGDGNIVKKYTNHNYSGIGNVDVNVTAMTKLHLDVYSPNFTSFKIKLEAVNGTNKEIEVPFTKTQGAWNSYDLDVSTYTGVDLAHLKWIVPVTNAGTTMYIDNVYFWKEVATAGSDATLSDLKVSGTTIAGFASATAAYTAELTVGTTTVPQITAVTTDPNATISITQATAIPGTATVVVRSQNTSVTKSYTVSFVATVPVASPKPKNYTTHLALLADITDTGAFTNFWNPSYYFGENQGTPDLDPSAGVNKAIKMNLNTGWGGGINTAAAGDVTTDVSANDMVHIDYFVPSSVAAGVSGHQFYLDLISRTGGSNKETFYGVGSTLSNPASNDPTTIDKVVVFDSWQSLDIPLSVFVGKGFNPATFFQLKLGASSDIRTKLVYFDNIFFYKGSTLGVKNFTLSNIAMYPNPVSNELTIEAKNTIQKVAVFNLLGQEVLSINPKTNSAKIQTSSLSKGVYVITATVDDVVSSSKFIKE
jgi:hypothetical protein